MDLRKTLEAETDRGAALVCAAFLEDALKDFLERSFVDAPKVVERLFGQARPLATFSSKIDLSFVNGSIGMDLYRGLHLVRKIRNTFAHYHRSRSFTDHDISSQCMELARVMPLIDDKEPRDAFVSACMEMIARIHAKTKMTHHIAIPSNRTAEGLTRARARIRATMMSILENASVELKEKLENPATIDEGIRIVMMEVFEKIGMPEEPIEVDD